MCDSEKDENYLHTGLYDDDIEFHMWYISQWQEHHIWTKQIDKNGYKYVQKKLTPSFHCPWYLKISSGSEMFNNYCEKLKNENCEEIKNK